ncbi:ABC transporter substrate-binding protein [Fictibacillus phosphorivorans]|uniref:ABC transporter substrate-binding protein n=1 Tax=Fictibacillus phosphorivorans TaxID=1221500 RepID=UPI00203BA6B5|nr:sugar ABC transporter substrate-binding protein [Fictibacillus phosphorivorans]MCM3718871.1 sugar ABC transporter substrate-binding protein [Fictibacillus phosphorivorans]MCM3776493.1 sugar ABC transporter substrate-binding protein [Fictibacillus phosphorivorans]
MRRFLFTILAVLLVLSGCQSAGNSGEKSNEKMDVKPPDRDLVEDGLPAFNEKIASLPKTDLEIWLAADYANEKPIQDAVKEFQSVYPNISVKTVGIEWGDMTNKVKLAVSSGAVPDMAHNHSFAFGAQGLAEPVDDLWKEWGEEDLFLPGGIEDVTWKGVKYGVPIDINTLIYLYNKKAFKKNGIKEAPKTFDELIEVSKKLTNKEKGQYGFVTNASGWSFFGQVVAQGTNILKFDGDKVTANLNDPVVVDTMKKYTDLALVHKASPVPPPQERQTDHPVAMFGTGRAASFISGPWDIARIKNEFPDAYKDLGTAVIPAKEKGSVLGGGSLFVPKGSKNKAASFELMKWFISDKYSIRLAKEMGRHPVKEHQYKDEFFNDPLLKPYVETLKYAQPYKLEAYPEANDAWGKALRSVFDGADVEKTLDNAQEVAEKSINYAK